MAGSLDIKSDPFARLRAAMGSDGLACIDLMAAVQAYYKRFPRDERLAQAFKILLEDMLIPYDPVRPHGDDNRIEVRGLAVLGEAGAGKSRAVRQLLGGHAAFPGYGDRRSDCQAITVEVRAPTTYLGLGYRIMAASGLPIKGKVEKHRIWELVYERLQDKRIFVLHLNELHNFFITANTTDRNDLLNTLKSLMSNPTWPVLVVVSGLPMLRKILQGHDEDRRRVAFVGFRSLRVPQANTTLAEIARELAAIAGLQCAGDFATNIAPRLAHAGLHQWGTCIKIMHNAVRMSLERRPPSLDLESFALAWAFMTGSAREANPFLARNWAALDCSIVLRENADPEESEEDTSKKNPGKRPRKDGR